MDEVLTVAEVAERLHVSRMHVYRMIERGRIRAIDISAGTTDRRTLRVPASELSKMMDEVVIVAEEQP